MPRQLLHVLIALFLLSCANPASHETATQDSASVEPVSTPQSETRPPEVSPSHVTALNDLVKKASIAFLADSASYYSMTISYSLTEGMMETWTSSATWYFDKAFSARYVRTTGHGEDSTKVRETELMLDANIVQQVLDVEPLTGGSATSRWSSQTDGIRTTQNVGGEAIHEWLPEDFIAAKQSEFTKSLETLRTLVNEGSAEELEDSYSVYSNTDMVEGGIKESRSATMPKALYNHFHL